MLQYSPSYQDRWSREDFYRMTWSTWKPSYGQDMIFLTGQKASPTLPYGTAGLREVFLCFCGHSPLTTSCRCMYFSIVTQYRESLSYMRSTYVQPVLTNNAVDKEAFEYRSSSLLGYLMASPSSDHIISPFLWPLETWPLGNMTTGLPHCAYHLS